MDISRDKDNRNIMNEWMDVKNGRKIIVYDENI